MSGTWTLVTLKGDVPDATLRPERRALRGFEIRRLREELRTDLGALGEERDGGVHVTVGAPRVGHVPHTKAFGPRIARVGVTAHDRDPASVRAKADFASPS
jgi:hypothetical protein